MARSNEEYTNEIGGYPSEDRTIFSVGTITAGTITSFQGTSPWVVSGTVNSLIQQNVIADSNNTSSGTVTLASGATWTGTATDTLGVVGLQVSLKTDQNCTVYVDQSPNGSDWDITDEYDYRTSIGNFGVTTQAINSYYRVRVKNDGVDATTYMRLQSCLCPTVEAVPRALDEDQNLRVGIKSIGDGYGFSAECTPVDELRVVEPVRLVGAVFVGNTVDTNFWTATTGGSGSVTQANNEVSLITGATAASTAVLQTVRTGRYISGSSNRFRAVLRLPDTGAANNTRKWGAFSATDGCYFKLSGTNFSVNTLRTGVENSIVSGSFNGVLGTKYTPDTNVKTYEMYWTNSKVWYSVGGDLLHTYSASTATWSDTCHLPVRVENINSATGTANVQVNVRAASISRLGKQLSVPIYKNFSSTQTAATGIALKLGQGNIHQLLVSGVVNQSQVALLDGTTASNGTIWYSGTMGANTTPFTLDFKAVPFFNGLTLVMSSANSNVTVIYE